MQVARQGYDVVFGRPENLGKTFTCLVCKAPVRVEKVGGDIVFLHAPGRTCDPRRAWVRAGMLAADQQLKRDPAQVRIVRWCSGLTSQGRDCKNLLYERLPDFDSIGYEEPSLILMKDAKLLMQLVFGHQARLVGAPVVLSFRPGKLVHKPAVWWQPKDGRRCEACERRYNNAQARQRDEMERLQAQQRLETERQERKFREERQVLDEEQKKLNQAWVRERQKARKQGLEVTANAATFARDYFLALKIPLSRVTEMGVVVRPCEHCKEYGAFVILTGIELIPEGLEAILASHHNLVSTWLRNLCARCGKLVHNTHHLYAHSDFHKY